MGFRLSDLERDVCKVYKTKDILMHLESCITENKPFSLVRFGDAGLGIMASFLADNSVDFGRKWGGSSGHRMANAVLNQITIPNPHRERILKRCVGSANNANYVDSYDSDLIGKFPLGKLAFNWKEVHQAVGISNTKYCSTMFHNFINVSGEYNIFDIMKGRRVFCINNIIHKIESRLQSKCKVLDFYRIPGRGKKGGHYKNHYQKLCNLLSENAKKYDLFLIGAGLLASIYCDVVKLNGGRALDVGTLFYLWNGMKVKSRASRYLTNTNKGLLCQRKQTPHKEAAGIW